MKLKKAYSIFTRKGKTFIGAQHWAVAESIESGRLKRAAGDALCKPAIEFFNLVVLWEDGKERLRGKMCRRCAQLAEQLDRTEP